MGGANIDIQGFPEHNLRLFDSNPGTVRMSSGGVGRNIAENAARLGLSVRFLSVFADDENAEALLEGLRSVGIDTASSLVVANRSTPTYLCILEKGGGLHVAVADMALLDFLDPVFLERRSDVLRGADLCVFDANLGEASLERGVDLCEGIPCLLDTVSVAKAKRAKGCIGRFFAVKPNEAELEVVSGVELRSESDIDRAVDRLHLSGTRQVFVSLGERGLYFSDGSLRGIAHPPAVQPTNTSGAGDAMSAALALGIIEGLAISETAALAAAAAALTTESFVTVNPGMGLERLREYRAAVRIRQR